MHPDIERELYDLTLNVIVHGRCLAEEWIAVGPAPRGTTKNRTLEVLRDLRTRQGFDGIDDDFVEEMGNQIRRVLNEYRDGIGDRALSGDVDTDWEQDKRVIKLVNLAWRWKKFRETSKALNDKLAAIQQVARITTSRV